MTTFSDILIDGNTISYGKSTPDGITDAYYSYQNAIYTAADAIITENFISGIGSSGSNPMVYIDNGTGGSGSCFISDNKFVRGVSTIEAYVVVNSSADQTIINNFFDGYTVDGVSNENLVIGLTATSTYKENKNQTGYMAVPKFPYMIDQIIEYPPTTLTSEWAKYCNTNAFDPIGSTTVGIGEGFSMGYTYPFVAFGNLINGIGPFTVENGSNLVSCNITLASPITTLSTGTPFRIRFNYDDVFYIVTTPTGSGNNLTGFTITSASDDPSFPSHYQGIQNSTAVGRFYNTAASGKLLSSIGTVANPIAAFNFSVDVNELLPTNVQVLTFIVGVYASSAGSSGSNIASGSFLSSAYASTPATYNIASLTGTMADVKNYTGQIASGAVLGGFTVPAQISQAALASATQYVINDISAQPSSVSNFFITGKGNVIKYIYSPQIALSVPDQNGTVFPGSLVNIMESPLIIKYRWI